MILFRFRNIFIALQVSKIEKMKKLLIVISFIALSITGYSQQTYTINNETLELQTEVEGNLDLLWNIIDGKYRYFVRTSDGSIKELVNTKNEETHKYQEEYKSVLNTLTEGYGVSTEKVNLTLFSLKEFFNTYNATTDLNYNFEKRAKLQSRLGVFGGLTNHPVVENPNNESVPFFGVEFEVFEQNKLPRHALFFHLRHALESDDFKYSSTQLAIGYRFRFINKEAFNLYANLKMVTYSHSDGEIVFEDTENPGNFIVEDVSSTGIQVPFTLGLGADIRVTKNGYIMLAYHEIFALFIDNSDNFPIDFAIGYKFNL